MPGMLSYAAAGVAQGLGQGIKERGKAKREAKLREIQHQREMQQDQRQFEQQSELVDKRLGAQEERLDRRLDAEGGRIAGSFTDDQGNVRGYTRGGDIKTLGKAQTEPGETQRIVSGDSDLGKQLGLKPGERANVTFRDQQPVEVSDPYTGTGTGSGKTYEFDRKYQAALEVYGGDKKKALEFAQGNRRMSDAEARKFGYEVAADELQNADLGKVERVGGASAWVDQRASEVARRIQSGSERSSAGALGPRSGSQGSGLSYEQAQQRAEREAESRDAASMWSDGDFGDMTREEWVTRRTRELMGGGRSQQPGQAARKPDILTPRSQRGSGNSAPAGDTDSDRPKAETRDGGGKTNAPTLPRDRSQWQKGKVYSHPAEGRVRYLGDDSFERVR